MICICQFGNYNKHPLEKLKAKTFFLKMLFPPQPYVYTTPPFVRVQRGRFYSDVTCFFEHVTHRVRLYNIHGKKTEKCSCEISILILDFLLFLCQF